MYVRIVASRSRTTIAICSVSVKTGSRIGALPDLLGLVRINRLVRGT
jgi:hypothetical protein